MRPRGVLLREMPGTMAWGHSGKCKSCVQPFVPDPSKPARPVKPVHVSKPVPLLPDGSRDVRTESTVSGLNSWMAGREHRQRVQTAKLLVFMNTGGHRLPALAPQATAQRPLRRTA